MPEALPAQNSPRSRGSRRFACRQNRRERLQNSAGRPAPGKRIRRGSNRAPRGFGATGPPNRREHKRDARRRRVGARAHHGYLLIAAAAFCWGSSAVLARAVFTGHWFAGARLVPVGPLVLTQTRIVLAALLLLPVLAVVRRGRLALLSADALRGAALGIAGMSVSNYFYYVAIARTTVAIAIILQYTTPIWVLLYLVARGRQRATPARLAAVGLALLGIALVLGLAHPGAALRLDPLGVAAALAAALGFTYYNIAGQTLATRVDPFLISLHMLLGAALVWLFISPPWRLWTAHYPSREWGFLLGFSLLATLLPTLLYISGLRHLDPTRAVVTSCLEPVTGILLAALFLGEVLDWSRALGVACVLGAVVLVQLRRRASPPATPPLMLETLPPQLP
ncbi:MAG TPA: DMT family transporter [Terriglobales bacterium]|nr:DMT family transporter [Terriglobales bacterium]